MKRTFGYLLMLIVVTCLSSCAVNNLMRSGDIDTQYETALRYYKQKKYNKAYTLFDNILANIAGTTKEDTLLFYMGKSAYNMKNYALAAETLDTYRKRFARTAFLEEAEYLHAMCYYKDSRPTEKDQAETHQAIIAFNEYLSRYPESPQVGAIHLMVEELQNKLYDKQFINAALYFKLQQYNAAITSLKRVLKDYPEIPQREEIMYLICKSWYEYAENSIFARQLDRYMKAIDAYFNYLTFYPESTTYRKELDRMYQDSKDFTDKYGYKAQKAERSANSIESRRRNIEECKERLFDVDTKEERKELKQTIKTEKLAIKEQKVAIKDDEKEYLEDRKALKLKHRQEDLQEKAEQKRQKAKKVKEEQIEIEDK